MYSCEHYTLIIEAIPRQARALMYSEDEEFQEQRQPERQFITVTQCSILQEVPCSSLSAFTMQMTAPASKLSQAPLKIAQAPHCWPVVLPQRGPHRHRGIGSGNRLWQCVRTILGS
jgi:hypothetical protein